LRKEELAGNILTYPEIFLSNKFLQQAYYENVKAAK
jgi:hypothetical protein